MLQSYACWVICWSLKTACQCTCSWLMNTVSIAVLHVCMHRTDWHFWMLSCSAYFAVCSPNSRMMLVWIGHEHFTLLLVLYCDSDSVKWVICVLLPSTLSFCKGAWELGPDCGSKFHEVLLKLQVTTSSMLLMFSELHNYCCLSYYKLWDISAPLLTKIIASFASHINMRKCARVCTLFALSFSPCMSHSSTLVPTGCLVCMSIFLYTCRHMSYVCSCWLECVSQAHLYLYTMLCQSCMLISCGVMARLAMHNVIIMQCVPALQIPASSTYTQLFINNLCNYMRPYWSMLIKMDAYIHALHIQSALCTLITYIM